MNAVKQKEMIAAFRTKIEYALGLEDGKPMIGVEPAQFMITALEETAFALRVMVEKDRLSKRRTK